MGCVLASGSFHGLVCPTAEEPQFPLTEGASLVVIYRVLSPNFPLKSVVIYDGSALPSASTTQNMQGFYDARRRGHRRESRLSSLRRRKLEQQLQVPSR